MYREHVSRTFSADTAPVRFSQQLNDVAVPVASTIVKAQAVSLERFSS
jgi:hypothetical protein